MKLPLDFRSLKFAGFKLDKYDFIIIDYRIIGAFCYAVPAV